MGIDIACPLCGIQRDINHPSVGYGAKPHECSSFQAISEQIA